MYYSHFNSVTEIAYKDCKINLNFALIREN